jgi:hypothetical protein
LFHGYSVTLFIIILLLQEGHESEESESLNKKILFHILEDNWQKRISCCHFEIKRIKVDGKLAGQLQMALNLDIPNTEQNQISLDFSIFVLTIIFFRRNFTFS